MPIKLKHSQHILAAKQGSLLMACEPVSGVNMRGGRRIEYLQGARFRVKATLSGLMLCFDEQMRFVSFDREEMLALERPSAPRD